MKRIKITDFIPTGIENAVSMTLLSARTGETKRTVRKLIQNARLNGELICSTCDGESGGYYIPLTPDEALPYYRQQRARINSGIAAIAAVGNYLRESEPDD